MGIYATPAELKAEPEIPDAMTDPAADALIESAEDAIDNELGPWTVHTTGTSEGRKIAEADVFDWQWAKLKRATVRLAVRLHLEPGILERARYKSVSGPDFSYSGPISDPGPLGDQVMNALRASGLIVATARAV
jgi:hypothetical protein